VAAAALIRSAPAVAQALAQVGAPAALIRSAPGSAAGQGSATAPASVIRSAAGTASGLAIMAGLGLIVTGTPIDPDWIVTLPIERRAVTVPATPRVDSVFREQRRAAPSYEGPRSVSVEQSSRTVKAHKEPCR
jgi:hypothetical protein